MSKEDAYMDGLLYTHLAECDAAQERQEWIDERADELIYDHDWFDDLDSSDLDKNNWREVLIQLYQLPILLIQNLSKLAPTWQQTWKEHKEVDQLLEIADTLYDLIKAKALSDAEDEYEKRLVENSYNDCNDDQPWDKYPCHY